MSIRSALGFGDTRKIRYAVIGLGDIAQEAMMPGIDHTGNSTVVALVSGNREKALQVASEYGVDAIYGYDDFAGLLASGTIDAIYIATPNFRHAEFAIPALEAGIHVLCEKPLEVSVEKCRAILEAEQASTAKMMTAYRLHFEPGTLDAIRRIRRIRNGELGDLICFTSCFTQKLDPANHRAKNGIEAGPLFDMGPYPINAIRYLFGAEPVEVVNAIGTRRAPDHLGDFDDTVAVTLRMPGDRLAQFTVSYAANGVDSFIVAGTEGSITMSPGYGFGKPIEHSLVIGEEQSHHRFKTTDQFGGEMQYFSACILDDLVPEPGAEEGLADLRIIEAIVRAMETRQPQPLEPFTRSRRIDPDAQERTLGAVSAPKLIDVADPTA